MAREKCQQVHWKSLTNLLMIKNIDKIMGYHEGYSEMRRSRDDGMIHELKDLIKRMESM